MYMKPRDLILKLDAELVEMNVLKQMVYVVEQVEHKCLKMLKTVTKKLLKEPKML
jgi:hypothetical protein